MIERREEKGEGTKCKDMVDKIAKLGTTLICKNLLRIKIKREIHSPRALESLDPCLHRSHRNHPGCAGQDSLGVNPPSPIRPDRSLARHQKSEARLLELAVCLPNQVEESTLVDGPKIGRK